MGFARYLDRTNGDVRLILPHGSEVAGAERLGWCSARQVNDYLRHLQAARAIVGGECWIDPNLNTPVQLVQVSFPFDFEPFALAERIVGRAHREPGCHQDLSDQVVLSLAA